MASTIPQRGLSKGVSFRSSTLHRRSSSRDILLQLPTTLYDNASNPNIHERTTTTTTTIHEHKDEHKHERKRLSRELSLGAKLGHTVESDAEGTHAVKKQHLYMVSATLFVCFITCFTVCFLIVYFGLDARSRSLFGAELPTIVKPDVTSSAAAVAFLGQWHQGQQQQNVQPKVIMGMGELNRGASAVCVARLEEQIQQSMTTGVGMTSPELIQTILQNMGLANQPIIRDYLYDLRTTPLPVSSAMEPMVQCLQASKTLPQLACLILQEIDDDDDDNNARSITLSIHVALVFQALTTLLTDNLAALHNVVEVMTTTQRVRREASFMEQYGKEQGSLMLQDYQDTATMLQNMAMALSENNPLPLKTVLQTNILEAVHHDYVHSGNNDTVQIGLALALAVHFEPTVQEHQLHWPLSKDWADAYMAWQTSLAVSAGQPLDSPLASLLIPLAACQSFIGSDHADNFMASQLVLQALSKMLPDDEPMHSTTTNNSTNGVNPMALQDLASRMASSNFDSVRLSTPSDESVNTTLGELCVIYRCHRFKSDWLPTDTVPTAKLDDMQFLVYLAFFLWITVLFAGLGMELLTWMSFTEGGWTEARQKQWIYAQFIFPLLLAITLGLAANHNYLALLCLVPGLWKFGFPETLVYMHTALYGTYINKEEGLTVGWVARVAEFTNAVGTIVHHGATSLAVCVLLAGVVPPSRHVLGPCLIPIMQHWFIMLRYSNPNIYTVVELALEAYFEWTIVSEFAYFLTMHWSVPTAAAAMLYAHWLYLIAAGLEFVKAPAAFAEEAVEKVVEYRSSQMLKRESTHTSSANNVMPFSNKKGVLKKTKGPYKHLQGFPEDSSTFDIEESSESDEQPFNNVDGAPAKTGDATMVTFDGLEEGSTGIETSFSSF